MDRRTFLKAISSAAVLLPWASRNAFAQSQPLYKGPFLLSIHASGGWDPTMFFDPKSAYHGTVINKSYTEPAVQGPFRYAPVEYVQSLVVAANTPAVPVTLHSPKRFLDKFQGRLLVLNGVDTHTNAHPLGIQRVWSGHVATEYPSIGALLAAKASESLNLPCAYLVNSGGYTRTLGLVPTSRVNTGNMRSIANQENFPDSSGGSVLFSPQIAQRIQQANAQRSQRLAEQLSMRESKDSLDRYQKAMDSRDGLVPLVESLPAKSVTLGDLVPEAGTATNINAVLQQAELALYGFHAGTTVSASIAMGDFDTHNNNDARQLASLGQLFVLIDYVLTKAEALGIPDLYVVVGSDFGRTNAYNNLNGKDHWNLTSLMVFGPVSPVRPDSGVQGGRVLGATTADQHEEYVDPSNPSQVMAGGVVLQTSHVHYELRRVLGLTSYNSIYGLLDSPIRLF